MASSINATYATQMMDADEVELCLGVRFDSSKPEQSATIITSVR